MMRSVRFLRQALKYKTFPFPRHIYNFCIQTPSLENLLKYELVLEKSVFACKGCGCQIQYNQKDEIGFLSKQKVIENLQKNEYLSLRQELLTQPESIEDDKLDLLLEQQSDIPSHKKEISLVCQRCFDIRHYQKNDIPQDLTVLTYEAIVKQIFQKIKNKNYAIYVLDIFNLNGTLDQQIIKKLIQKQNEIIFIVNKYDILPKDSVDSVVRGYVKKFIKMSLPEETEYKIFFVSAKTGLGLQQVIDHIKYCYKLHSMVQKKIYILGTTNTGKSTFINKLISVQNLYYKQKIEENHEPITTSAYPHTTLDFIKVKHVHLGFPLYDTPGIPSIQQRHTENYIEKAKQWLITKQLTPFGTHFNAVVNLQTGYSVYIGGLARIDFLSGDNLDIYVYASSNFGIHKTLTEKANLFYLKQYDQILTPVFKEKINTVQFKSHVVDIYCDDKGHSTEEIEISGVGVLGFKSKRIFRTQSKIVLFLPEFVSFEKRPRMLPLKKVEKRNVLNKRHIKN